MEASTWNRLLLDKLASKSSGDAVEALKTYLVERLGRLLYEKKEPHRDVRVENVGICRIADKTTICFSLVEGVRRIHHEKEWTDKSLMAETCHFTTLIERELHQALKSLPPGQREDVDEEAVKAPRVTAVKVIMTIDEGTGPQDFTVYEHRALADEEISSLYSRAFDRVEKDIGGFDFKPTGTESMTITLRKKS